MLRAKWFVLLAALLVATAAQADLIINEVMQNPNAVFDSAGEWFEVYNNGVSDVDLNGYTISDLGTETFDITTETIITAGQYFIFGVNGDFGTNGGVNVDYVFPATFFLGNGDDELYIYDAGDVLVDFIAWDGGPVWPDPTGASMSLIDPGLDNNDGSNWMEANTPYGAGDFGTPGAANIFGEQPPLVINEVMQNPAAVSDAAGEWFELYNPGSEDVDLDGWRFANATDTEQFTVSGTVLVAAGGYAVLANNGDFGTNGGVNVDYTYPATFFLGNGADQIYVYNALNELQDQVDWDGGPVWPDPAGASMELISPDLDNNNGANWMTAESGWDGGAGDLGSPGLLNGTGPTQEPDTLDVTIGMIQTDTQTYEDPLIVVHFSGVVTAGDDIYHATYVDVYLQDETGYGINLYDVDPALTDGVVRGDELEIYGQVLQYFDTTEIINFSWTLLSSGNPMPDPIQFTDTNDFFTNALPWEGSWGEISGEIQEPFTPGPGISYNFTLDDGSGPATVRIWADAGLDLSGYAAGDNLTVRGVIDGFNGLAQIYPALQEDIELTPTGPVQFTLTGTTTTVPATGGNIYYNAHIQSSLPGTYPGVIYRTYITAPNSNVYGPLTQVVFTLNPFMNYTVNGLSQFVPANAPAGDYTFEGRLTYGVHSLSDTFGFTKEAPATGNLAPDKWPAGSPLFASDGAESSVELPTVFAVSQAFPNPFNPTTTVAVSLPEASQLTVTVFNVMGQAVATLVNGHVQAGVHNFGFDATHLSSGLYFIQATVPGRLNEIQKVTLMK